MIFDIRYRTEYRYAGRVTDNMNALRVQPANTSTQRLAGFSLAISPETRLHEHVDYFGTRVHEFEVTHPHEALTIDVGAVVETKAPAAPPDPPWSSLENPVYVDAGAEYLLPHPGARAHPVLDELSARAQTETPLTTALRLAELIPETFEYRPGVTYVGSTVADLLEAGGGVCQDFVHLALALLRRCGVAARYCSGYLFAVNGDGSESAEVETHAWLEIMLPGGMGDGAWIGLDPTNRGFSTEGHVKIGHGRWYSDVPPIKGIFRGPSGGDLTANVRMTRLDGRTAADTGEETGEPAGPASA